MKNNFHFHHNLGKVVKNQEYQNKDQFSKFLCKIIFFSLLVISLKLEQTKPLDALIAGKSVLAILLTSFGKSLDSCVFVLNILCTIFQLLAI